MRTVGPIGTEGGHVNLGGCATAKPSAIGCAPARWAVEALPPTSESRTWDHGAGAGSAGGAGGAGAARRSMTRSTATACLQRLPTGHEHRLDHRPCGSHVMTT